MGTEAVRALLLPAEITTGTIDLTLLQKHKKEHPSKVLRCLAVLWNSPVAQKYESYRITPQVARQRLGGREVCTATSSVQERVIGRPKQGHQKPFLLLGPSSIHIVCHERKVGHKDPRTHSG